MALTKNKKYNICQEQTGKNGHITKSATAIVKREWEKGGKREGEGQNCDRQRESESRM